MTFSKLTEDTKLIVETIILNFIRNNKCVTMRDILKAIANGTYKKKTPSIGRHAVSNIIKNHPNIIRKKRYYSHFGVKRQVTVYIWGGE